MKSHKFIEEFENKAKKTISDYNLANRKERIAVAVSGGKDSTAVLYLLKKFGYNIFAVYIDLGIGDYSKKCLKNIKEFCSDNKIKIHVVSMKKEFGCNICYIRSNIQEKHKLSNCTICGVIKRWILNKEARKLKATRLATGHNLDDEAQTILVNFLKGNVLLGMNSGPLTGIIKDKKFVTRIKPLYFHEEKDIKKYSKIMQFPVLYERCPCAIGTYRIETRKFLAELDKDTKRNIVNNFLKILPSIRNHFYDKVQKLRYCSICGEPSRNDICNACKLIAKQG
jgi:uncharacterized protein (TIGR00269 family)